MHKPLLIILILLTSCAPRISKQFDTNRYIHDINIHVLNDSLQLHLISPADISYVTHKKDLRKALRKSRIKTQNEVLLFGKTDSPPYTYAVTVSSSMKTESRKNSVLLDTIISGKTISFIGTSGKAGNYSLNADLKNIMTSLKQGDHYREGIGSAMDFVQNHMGSNKFYNLYSDIRNYPVPENQGNSLEAQMQLTYASFLGNNKIYNELIDKQESKVVLNDTIGKQINKYGITDSLALSTIVNQARAKRIVMLNENHFYPNHRLLINELLPMLKENGYTYLAMETISAPNDSLLNLKGAFPTLNTGFYTREQNYGNLIRQAKTLGYKFVAYENTDKKEDREIGQAKNLFNKTFAIDSGAKVIVLAGIDHILEEPTPKGKKWMAAVFKEKYHIDPLTISQTHLNLYRKYSPGTYKLIAGNEFGAGQNLSAVDFYVLNNQHQANLWKSSFKYHNKNDFEVQVALFYTRELKSIDDYKSGIPYFTTILEQGKTYHLPINKGDTIYLVIYDSEGGTIGKEVIRK